MSRLFGCGVRLRAQGIFRRMGIINITVLFLCLAVGGTIGARPKRASGGREIKIEDAPYFVSLTRYGSHVCGGAFINTQYVLTAAHCVLDESFRPMYNTIVVSGTDVPDKTNVGHRILNISAHEGFPERRRACNIAVITLSAHLVWNEKQHAIALPNAVPRCEILATLVGFQFHKSRRSDRGLRELRVKICPIDPTSNNPDDYGPVIYGTITAPQSITDRNLGGALVYEGRIVGIASARQSQHAVNFVNVLKFKTFIEQSMVTVPPPTGISWVPSVVDFDDIEWD